jgi:hypothetical protein
MALLTTPRRGARRQSMMLRFDPRDADTATVHEFPEPIEFSEMSADHQGEWVPSSVISIRRHMARFPASTDGKKASQPVRREAGKA